MAKQSYRIPNSLDKSMGDIEVRLVKNKMLSIRAFTMKEIGLYMLSFFVWIIFIFKTFMASGGVGTKFIFTLSWFGLVYLLVSTDKTKTMGVEVAPLFAQYFPKSKREIYTRSGDNASDFLTLLGATIESGGRMFDNADVIRFNDGRYGMMFKVEGNASRLLFDSDARGIVDGVDAYYRRLKSDALMINITLKEPQDVSSQLDIIKLRREHLKRKGVLSKDLAEVLSRQESTLADSVGREFKSIHQYVIICAYNKESLAIAIETLIYNGSAGVYKSYELANADIISDVFKTLLTGEGKERSK